ncbi:hypothetical protein Tco_1369564 [Tanacetum coccineum]
MPQLVSNPTPHPPTLPIKRLTPAQMAARREKGLCYNCQFVPKTLKLEGFLGDQPVVVLIDGGSTHNFVQTRLAKHLSLVIQPSPLSKCLLGEANSLLRPIGLLIATTMEAPYSTTMDSLPIHSKPDFTVTPLP